MFWGQWTGRHGNTVHLSRFGVIPKLHQPGKWRLIVDLSHPSGASINDGASRELCSLTYASVDDATKLVLEAGHGRGAILAKLDVQSAYRNVLVHPDDRPLLGMEWNGELGVRRCSTAVWAAVGTKIF